LSFPPQRRGGRKRKEPIGIFRTGSVNLFSADVREKRSMPSLPARGEGKRGGEGVDPPDEIKKRRKGSSCVRIVAREGNTHVDRERGRRKAALFEEQREGKKKNNPSTLGKKKKKGEGGAHGHRGKGRKREMPFERVAIALVSEKRRPNIQKKEHVSFPDRENQLIPGKGKGKRPSFSGWGRVLSKRPSARRGRREKRGDSNFLLSMERSVGFWNKKSDGRGMERKKKGHTPR